MTGFILGILSVTLGCLCFPPLFGVPGLVFSMIGRKQAIERNEEGQGLAVTGIILSTISTGLVVLGIIFYIALIIAGLATGSWQDFQ